MLNAGWFNNRQENAEVLQPDFFSPKTQLWIYAELPEIEFPIKVNITAQYMNNGMFQKSYIIENVDTSTECKFELFADANVFVLRDFPNTLAHNPDQIDIEICMGKHTYTQTIACEYATISGKITDFDDKPFPAAVVYNLLGFEGMETGLGVWSDTDGNYSITLPKGDYNSIFVDDSSYGQTSLEAWGWKMIVDRDEIHDYKIGNGEVYSLDVWANNGGFQNLFIVFRPMALAYVIKQSGSNMDINSKDYTVVDTCPDIDINDVSVKINNCNATVVSLQKIFETGSDGLAMPLYVLQVERLATSGKQTLVVEYGFTDSGGNIIQSQGRTQFNYVNVNRLAIR